MPETIFYCIIRFSDELNLILFPLILFFRFPSKIEGPGFSMVKKEGDNEKEERENAEKEKLVEEEDPEELARQRAMDEFKDTNKRGWGNRYNRS